MSLFTRDSGGQLWRIDVATDGTLISTSVSSGSGAGTTTAAAFIQSALRLLGAVSSGVDPTEQEITDGLAVLNDLLDSWNTERNAIYTIQPNTLTLVSGTQSYTVGPSGDLNIPRPPRITEVILRDSSGSSSIDTPLKLISREQWQSISLKDFGNTFPEYVYDDDNYPTRTLSFWPKPGSSQTALVYGWYPLVQVTDDEDTISLPPGYARALRYNLAVDLYPEYKTPGGLDPVIAAIARESKEKVKAMNSKPVHITPDAGVFGSSCGVASSADFLKGGF